MRVIDTFRTVESLAFSPDGRWIASAGFRHVSLWELATGKERRMYSSSELVSATNPVFSRDGSRMAWILLGSHFGRYVTTPVLGRTAPTVLDGADTRFAETSNHGFLPDGRHVAMDRGTVTAARVDRPTQRDNLFRPRKELERHLDVSPSAALIAVGGLNGIETWSLSKKGWEATTIEARNVVRLGFTPSGLLWYSDHKNVTVVDPISSELVVRNVPVPFPVLAMSPNGRWAYGAVIEKSVLVFDLWEQLEKAQFDWGIGRVKTVAISHDGLTGAASGTSGQIAVFDLE